MLKVLENEATVEQPVKAFVTSAMVMVVAPKFGISEDGIVKLAAPATTANEIVLLQLYSLLISYR